MNVVYERKRNLRVYARNILFFLDFMRNESIDKLRNCKEAIIDESELFLKHFSVQTLKMRRINHDS